MKFVLSPDSFKGSLTAEQAAAAMEEGIRAVYPQAEICILPIADGGEGTMQVLYDTLGGVLHTMCVPGPYGQEIQAAYLMQGNTAIIELAKASGLTLSEQRVPINASTYGTGLLLRDALLHGATHVCLTLGGSATNDGGAGIAKALGIRLLDRSGEEVEPTCAGLQKVVSVDIQNVLPQAITCQWSIACDVKNPLCGATGASAVYGPQKGADAAMVTQMDTILSDYGALLERKSGRSLRNLEGSGAAGGAALPLLAFMQAQLCSGIDMVLDAVGFDRALECADWVFTGEGRIDIQTRFGKAIAGIVQRAKAKNVAVGVFAGALGITKEECPEGMYLCCISDEQASVAENMANAYINLKKAVTDFLKETENT